VELDLIAMARRDIEHASGELGRHRLGHGLRQDPEQAWAGAPGIVARAPHAQRDRRIAVVVSLHDDLYSDRVERRRIDAHLDELEVRLRAGDGRCRQQREESCREGGGLASHRAIMPPAEVRHQQDFFGWP
jgi:hypothetical protein